MEDLSSNEHLPLIDDVIVLVLVVCIRKFRHADMTQTAMNTFKMFLSYIFSDIL